MRSKETGVSMQEHEQVDSMGRADGAFLNVSGQVGNKVTRPMEGWKRL